MSKDEILFFIATCDDAEVCDTISNAAAKRRKEIHTKAYEARVAEFWKRTNVWKVGQTLYCGAAGTFIGGPLQRGDKGTIYAIQPKKKVLWLSIGKRTIGFNATMLLRYHLQPDPPENPATKIDRAISERLAKAF